MSKQYTIVAVTSNKFTIHSSYGDLTSLFIDPISLPPVEFDVRGSTGNNGRYKVSSSIFSGGQTEITIDGTMPSGIVDGYITNTTAYLIESTNASNSFVILPTQSDNSTSIELTGRNLANWGEVLLNNMYHLLENFANPTAPVAPLDGQIWYDTTVSKLKVWDGSVWQTIGSSSAPSTKYTHTQGIAASTWNINHSLGTTDLVYSVYVQVGLDLVPILPNDIAFVDADNITVTFSTSYTGKVVLIAN